MADQIFNIPLFIHFQYLTDLIYFGKPNLVFFIYFKSKISRHSKGVSVIVHTRGRKGLGVCALACKQVGRVFDRRFKAGRRLFDPAWQNKLAVM